MKEDKRYPIGQFEYGKTYSIADVQRAVKEIAKLPKQLKKTVKKLSGGDLDKSYRTGGWTARQVIHHLVDSHVNAYIRFKLAVTEDKPTIKPYDEQKWAELPDGKLGSIKDSLRLLTLLHKRLSNFLSHLSDADLKREYFHPGNNRTFKISEGIMLYSWHGRHHLAHIKIVANGGGIFATAEENTVETAAVPKEAKRRGRPRAEAAEPAAPMTKVAMPIPARRGRPAKDKPEVSEAEKAARAEDIRLRRGEILAKARAARKPKDTPTKSISTREPAKVRLPKQPKIELSAAEQAAKAEEIRLRRIEILAKARAARKPKAPSEKPVKVPKIKAEKPPKVKKERVVKVKTERTAEELEAIRLHRIEILAKARAARKPKAPSEKPVKVPKVKAEKPPKIKKERVVKVKPERTAEELEAIRLKRIEVITKARAARFANLSAQGRLKSEQPAKPVLSPEQKAIRDAELKEQRLGYLAAARVARAANKVEKPAKIKKEKAPKPEKPAPTPPDFSGMTEKEIRRYEILERARAARRANLENK